MEVAKIENVTRVYQIGKVETQALRGVNLSIESGEFTALVGPSGIGKDYPLQLIGCLDQTHQRPGICQWERRQPAQP
jgi:putative ABC transport system ATP-binding protein